MTVAAERALFVVALGSGERMPARRSTELNIYYELEAGLDEVKNSVGMNHPLRKPQPVESSVASKA